MISEDMIFELIKRLKEFVQTKNISECRNFLQSYIEKVIVYADRVEVLFKIHVPGCDTDTVSLFKSGETIKVLQSEYKSG